MKNYICTGKGFVKSSSFDKESLKILIEYTDKVRHAQNFNTKAAISFMEKHNIEGFVWRPYAQEPLRDMYVVKQRNNYGFDSGEDNDMVEEWKVEKAFMRNESDIAFLMSKSMAKEKLLTFDEAKAKALELNMEMINELNDKLNKLVNSTEPQKK